MKSCFLRKFAEAKEALKGKLQEGYTHWIVTFSGGKDSTASLIIALEAALEGNGPERIDIVYCDTGVEIPPVREGAVAFLEKLKSSPLPLHCHILRPRPEDGFWACLLGRGYPPPHHRFRWCTRRLKILPVRQALGGERSLIITGVRLGESKARDHRLGLSCSRGGECGHGAWAQEAHGMRAEFFAPLISWTECTVWDFLRLYAPALGYDVSHLAVYVERGLRFGCWMCTVVKEDRALEALSSRPQWAHLRPLLSYRSLVMEVASKPSKRLLRPDGRPGRLRLEVREELLEKLRELEEEVSLSLISPQEAEVIMRIWKEEKNEWDMAASYDKYNLAEGGKPLPTFGPLLPP
jgi:DNA sulfur modification protein DndC